MRGGNFGADLKRAIDGQGLTIPQFAEKIGISSAAVGKWINGKSFPLADKWGDIKRIVLLDVQNYVEYESITAQGKVTEPLPVVRAAATTHGDRSHNIIGAPGSIQTVSESHFSEGPEPAPKKATNNEMTAEQGIALKLMLKYWDSKLVQGCLSRLKQIDEELG